jgi:hypothetical protein
VKSFALVQAHPIPTAGSALTGLLCGDTAMTLPIGRPDREYRLPCGGRGGRQSTHQSQELCYAVVWQARLPIGRGRRAMSVPRQAHQGSPIVGWREPSPARRHPAEHTQARNWSFRGRCRWKSGLSSLRYQIGRAPAGAIPCEPETQFSISDRSWCASSRVRAYRVP